MGTVWMWIRHAFLGLFGFSAGIAIAAGTFAFIIMIGIVPRIAARSNTAKHTFCYENAILLGGLCGDLLSVFLDVQIPGGRPLLILYGFCAGIFVGCVAVALAEILKALPIFLRRGSYFLWHSERCSALSFISFLTWRRNSGCAIIVPKRKRERDCHGNFGRKTEYCHQM